MKALKKHWGGIVLCLLEILVGVLLLIDPIELTNGIIVIVGVILGFAGLVSIVKYFRCEAAEAAAGQLLMKGLLAILVGVFCVLKSQWFIATFPVLTSVYGAAVLVTGLSKIQRTVDMVRAKQSRWFLGLLSAVATIAFAVVILENPFATTEVLWTFIGIALIAEAVLDAVAMLFGNRKRAEPEPSDEEEA